MKVAANAGSTDSTTKTVPTAKSAVLRLRTAVDPCPKTPIRRKARPGTNRGQFKLVNKSGRMKGSPVKALYLVRF